MTQTKAPAVRPAPPKPARPASRNIRIVIADDHPVIRIGVRNMLQAEPGLEVAGECNDGDEAITQTLELLPDILLLDVYMPRLPGIEAMRAIMTGSSSTASTRRGPDSMTARLYTANGRDSRQMLVTTP